MKPILIDEELKKYLDKKKLHPRESYNSVLERELGFSLKKNELKGGNKK